MQDRQRLNVALTRAKFSPVVVGNMDTLQVIVLQFLYFISILIFSMQVRCGRSW